MADCGPSSKNGMTDNWTQAHERAVLSCKLAGQIDDTLRPEHFELAAHRALFEVLTDMQGHGIAISLQTAIAAADQFGRMAEIGDPAAIAAIANESNIAGIDYYVQKLLEQRQRQQLTRSAEGYLRQLRDESSNVDELNQRFLASIESHQPRQKIEFFNGKQLAELDTSIEWLVDDVLVKGQPTLQAAPKKCLKTNTSIDLVISLASGTPFLGHFKIRQRRRAGLMSAESGAATIKETAHRIAMSKGFNGVQDVEDVFFAFETPMVADETDCQQFRRIIDHHQLDVLIVDPTYLTFVLGDEGKNIFRMGRILSPLSRIGQETGCTIMLSHHSRKGAGRDGEPLELGDESFSGFSEWARQWLYLSRREPYDETRPGSHSLWLRFGGSAGHAGLIGLDIQEGRRTDSFGRRWDVTVQDAAAIIANRKEAAQAQRERAKDETFERNLTKVSEALKSFPQGETKSIIATKAKVSGGVALSCLFELESHQQAKQCSIIKGGKQYDGWMLSDSDKSDNESDNPSCPIEG